MKNGYFIQTLLLATAVMISSSLCAQKIDIDKKSVSTTLIALPEKNIDTAFHTFSFQFKGEQFLNNWGMDPEAVKNSYFKLAGYQSVDKDGDLQLEANLQQVRFLESKVESRTEKSKDKSGRETSQTYYKCVLTYESGFFWSIRDKNGRDLTGAGRSSALLNTGIKKYNCRESTNYKEAAEAYTNNRQQINRDIATSEINNFLGEMSQRMNRMFGYRQYKDKFNLWIVDSKSHPETAAFTQHYEAVKTVFEAISPQELKTSDLDALQPSIAYYQSIPDKYKADEKSDIKLRYAAYFNLSNIYLFFR